MVGTPKHEPCATATPERTERTERTERAGEQSATSGEARLQQAAAAAQLSPAGSGYGNDREARGETLIYPRGGGTILVDNRSETEKVNCHQQDAPALVTLVEEEEEEEEGGRGPPSSDGMGNVVGFRAAERSSSSGSAEGSERRGAQRNQRDIPQIAIIEASPLPAAEDGSMFELPGLHCGQEEGGQGGTTPPGQIEGESASLYDVPGCSSSSRLQRRRNSTGSQCSLRSAHPPSDGDEPRGGGGGGGSLSGSEDAATPRGSRQNFIELMINSSPQVRRSMALRNSVHLIRCKDWSRSDGDSASLASSTADSDRVSVAAITLDPLEHAWMMSASDGEWAGLQLLLADEPGLVLKKDFVTGFTCLHWAAKQGKAELLALLVNFSRRHSVPVDLDVRSGAGGYTPLHLAAMHGHAHVVKLLVDTYHADPEVRDYSGKKACQYLSHDANTTVDTPEVAGASRGAAAGWDSDQENALNGGTSGARRRFSNVLHPHLRLLHPHHPHPHPHHPHLHSDSGGEHGAADAQRRSKPVRRKSSLSDMMRPKLQRLRDRTSRIVHSVSFHDAQDLAGRHAHT